MFIVFLFRVLLFFCSFVLCFSIVAFISCLITGKKEHINLFKRSSGSRYKKRSFLSRILFDFPVQFGRDVARSDPDFFAPNGIVIFEGDQGDGKSISMVQYAYTLKMQYPECKVISNTPLTFQDGSIKSFDDLVNIVNGTKGIVSILDECQLFANSKLSKDFDPNILQTVCQNRKNRRIILMTAQRLYMLNKDIRCLCTEVRSCKTVLGVLTFVVRRKPYFDSEGKPVKTKFLGMYFFIQSDKLRSMYDTYKVIDIITKSGFKSKEKRYNSFD